jgi:hypothetical protein
MRVTKIVGKADPAGNWIVKPSHHRVGKDQWARDRAGLRAGTTYVRVRPEADIADIANSRRYAGNALQRVAKEFLATGKCTVNVGSKVERTDLGDPRSSVRTVLEFDRDKPTAVDLRTACWLLNPQKWGKVFEECDTAGAVAIEPTAKDEEPEAPKKPSGKKRQEADKKADKASDKG